ncbi:MAG: restriction endonuclease subunit S, partial [Bacteroides sp.]|nr:restriction endonuclease subunit S [Bacteroides sp.]
MDTKKLRQKILDLAFRGKLVPQDPNDEPASILLERIRAEKERLIAEGKIKRPKKSKTTSSESHYQQFDIPLSWEWTTLGEIFSMRAGKNIQASDLQIYSDEAPFPCYGGNGIRGYLPKFSHQGTFPIIGRQGALCGNINVASGSFYATEHAVVVEYFSGTSVELWTFFLEYLNLNQYATATAQPGLSVAKIEEVPIPLPPINEQYRIVEKISEWLSTLDTISLDVNDLRCEIEDAKSKILELAMEGKLVPQDPADESAAEMLKRINPKANIITDNPHYPN